MSKTNYEVTIGYKAVITVAVQANNESEAKEMAVKIMTAQRDKMLKRSGFELQDDNYAAHGVVNMDETWNILD